MNFEKSTPLTFKTSWIICGDSQSEISGILFKIGCNSVCVSLAGRVVSLVCLYIQLFLFWKHLQYKAIDRALILIAATGVPMVKNVLTFINDQKLWGYVLSFVNMLFMLKIDKCFISRILLPKTCNLLPVRLDVFKDYIKLKLCIFE